MRQHLASQGHHADHIQAKNLLGDSRKNFHSLREELEACQAEVSALQEVSVAQDGNPGKPILAIGHWVCQWMMFPWFCSWRIKIIVVTGPSSDVHVVSALSNQSPQGVILSLVSKE